MIDTRVRNSSAPRMPAIEDGEAAEDDDQAERARTPDGRASAAARRSQAKVQRQRDDQEAVRIVVVVGPVRDELDDDVAIQRPECQKSARQIATTPGERKRVIRDGLLQTVCSDATPCR